MALIDTVSARGVRVRIRSWRGSPDVAELAALPAGAAVPSALVREAAARAADRGFVRAVTPALATYEWRPFVDAGFVVREELHLLGHQLLDIDAEPLARTRRVLRRDRPQVLSIDHRAFPPFWHLDHEALDEAVRATPATRFRMTRDGVGYALVGRAGDRGYVQRLAVDPEAQGNGYGAALVLDGLRWLKRWRVREALVNTQVDNQRALALYQRLGFRRRREGLGVLELVLDDRPSHDRPGR